MAGPNEGDTPSFGAGEEPKSDAFAVFPAGTRREPAPEAKPTHNDAVTGEASASLIDLAVHLPAPDAGAGIARDTDALVTVRSKPEKRKNAKERARERFAGKTAGSEDKRETKAAAERKAAKAERKEKAKKAKSGR